MIISNLTYNQRQQDATGVQEFEYGNMGEMIKNRHTYVVPNSEPFTLTTEWEYDSWNRVKRIIYPDNEKVVYNYNLGGLLNHVEGDKPSIGVTEYIKHIEYDQFEQRTAVYNGNQTETYYGYDPVMRRMTSLHTRNQNGDLLKLKYTYDNAGNIIRIENTGLNPYVQEYGYDDTYQLVHANGNWDNQINYDLNMKYSPAGRILNKKIGGHRIDNQGTYILDYNNKYTYGANNNPYALKHIIDNNTGKEHYFNWDEKGNMIYHNDKSTDNVRRLCWTEDNRLQAVKDNKMGAYYNYDAQGERNLKLTGGTINITQNGQNIYVPVLDQQTLYASALVTVNDKGYTKHYFEEGKRICSKIGSGELRNVDDWIGHMGMNYEEQRSIQFDGVTKTYEQCMNITPHVKNRNLYKDIIKKYQNKINSSEPSFYYHSDHLGSASFLTDETGSETQQLVYLPFGEDWVDMKYNNPQFQTPYKFNGKEKDPETGYNYFGARYYYDWATIWLSVDPMSDKYPHLTSYNYCANNPIMLTDPNGEDPKFYAILLYKGQTKSGNNLGGNTHKIGEFTIVPIVNNSNKIIGYNAGRESANGEFRTEYQMEPGDLRGFRANVDYYEAAANLFYTNGEPNMNYAMLGDAIANGDFKGALTALVNAWSEASKDPGFYLSVATAIAGMGNSISNNSIAPKGWISKASRKNGGVIFTDPNNPNNNIRVMPGNPSLPFPSQRKPYVKYQKNGRFYDVNGNPLPDGKGADAHIPLNKYNKNVMP